MKILAIDTATEACSVAIWCDGQINEHFVEQPKGHGTLILRMIDAILNETGIKLNELNAVAFGRGPGGFTGVRMAVSVAQAIGFGADLPLIPISNLAMLAQGWYRISAATHIIPALDARMQEIYIASYRIINELAEIVTPEQVIAPNLFTLNFDYHTWHGVGRGWSAHKPILTAQLGQQLTMVTSEFLCHAQDALPLAITALNSGNTILTEQALPVYLRDKVATSPLKNVKLSSNS
jgi:tRNA threonylcarbamoyladenosine biosynthesis protein TsaB